MVKLFLFLLGEGGPLLGAAGVREENTEGVSQGTTKGGLVETTVGSSRLKGPYFTSHYKPLQIDPLVTSQLGVSTQMYDDRSACRSVQSTDLSISIQIHLGDTPTRKRLINIPSLVVKNRGPLSPNLPLAYLSLQGPVHSTWPQGFLRRTRRTLESLASLDCLHCGVTSHG